MRLYLMRTGVYAGDNTPYPAYLIQTDDVQNILVDTGISRHICGDYVGDGLSARALPEDKLPNRLAAIGLQPDDIHYVISTHLDIDHCGNHDLFPNAEFIIQRKQFEAARTGNYQRFEVTRRNWHHPQLRYRLVDGDTRIFPGIELIETSGHVPGHQSVLVRLPKTGPVLLTIDALHRGDLLDPQNPPVLMFTEDEAEARRSLAKLAALVQRERVRLVVVGHDPDRWSSLIHSPEFYA